MNRRNLRERRYIAEYSWNNHHQLLGEGIKYNLYSHLYITRVLSLWVHVIACEL